MKSLPFVATMLITALIPNVAVCRGPKVTNQQPILKNVSEEQAHILNTAYAVAKKDGLKDPKLLPAILIQETKAGADPKYLNPKKGNFGISQIRINTAKEVLKQNNDLARRFKITANADNDTIAHKLTHDNSFSLAIASRYLSMLSALGFKTPQQLALAYNRGPGGAKHKFAQNDPYVRGVMSHIKTIYRG